MTFYSLRQVEDRLDALAAFGGAWDAMPGRSRLKFHVGASLLKKAAFQTESFECTDFVASRLTPTAFIHNLKNAFQNLHYAPLKLSTGSWPAIMLTILKTWLQKLMHPLARILFDDGVRAIHVTSCAGLISVAVGMLVAAFAFHPPIFVLIPIWMLIRTLFNAVEAVLIGEFGQHSKLGTCAHELSRVIAETALFLPFAVIPKVSLLLVLLVTLLAILSEFAGLLGPLIKASRRRDGPMKSDVRMLCFGIFGAGIGSGYVLTAPINIALAAMALLLVMTIISRIRRAVAEVNRPVTASSSKVFEGI